MFRRALRRLFAPIDRPLALVTVIVLGLGVINLYSAADGLSPRFMAQMTSIGIALGVLLVAAHVPPSLLMRIALPAYLLGLLMLFAVAGFGEIVNGARRWLDLGITRVQPSEMMRIAVPLMLATYFHRREADLSYIDYLAAAILLGLPVALIASQPDLGTALLIAASGSYVIFLAGLSWKMIAGLGIAAIGASPVAWTFLHDYQRERVLTLFNPEADPLGAGYHTIQSTIAVGSGGLFGKGWLHGT